MTFRQLARISASLALTIGAAVTSLRAQELSDVTYMTLRDAILPKPDELAWRKIVWRPSFWEAVVESHRKDKPILLWTMNGHPLCNT